MTRFTLILAAGLLGAGRAAAQLHHIVGVSIPVGSNDRHSAPSLPGVDGVWSVEAPPFPLNTELGIGYAVSLEGPTYHVLNDHVYVAPHIPDPERAQITFTFDRAVVVDHVEVIQDIVSIVRMEALVGDSVAELASIGDVPGSAGMALASRAAPGTSPVLFRFGNTRAGSVIRLIIRRTGSPVGYGTLQIFPRDRVGRRFLGALDERFDADGDGIQDVLDNCPVTPNPDQRDSDQDLFGDACDPDRDGDCRKDAEDNCPEAPNPLQEDSDGDGLGDRCDPDADGDGRENAVDNAPGLFNPQQADSDGDGIAEALDPDAPLKDGRFEGLAPGLLLANGIQAVSWCPWHARGSPDVRIAITDAATPVWSPSEGSQCVLFNVGGAPAGGSLEQAVATVPGSTYALAFSVGKSGQAPGKVGVRCEVRTASGMLLGECNVECSTTGWRRPHQIAFCAASPRTTLRFTDVSEVVEGADLGLDSIVLEPCPESPVAAGATTSPALDADADGILDSADNCPRSVNPDQRDLDSDGVGDACDDDLDGDQVSNSMDNCLTAPNPDQEDLDRDGAGDACDAVHLACITRVEVPSGDAGLESMAARDGAWIVGIPPFPLADDRGVGFLVGARLPPALVLHDNRYLHPHVPHPEAAVITFLMDRQVAVDGVEVIQHTEGITQIEAHVGDAATVLQSLGVASCEPVNGRGFAAGEASRFSFDHGIPASLLRLVVTRTSDAGRFGAYQVFPLCRGQRLLGAVADSDFDEDGIPTSQDRFPGIFNSNLSDLDGDGIPDSLDDDRDGDGVANDRDNCPNLSNPGQGDQDRDSRGDDCDNDIDGEGIENRFDISPRRDNWNPDDADGDGTRDAEDGATETHVIHLEVPAGSQDERSTTGRQRVWSVAVPPYPLNHQSGVGRLISPGPLTTLTLHSHGFPKPHLPAPERSSITYHFDSPQVVGDLEVRQHHNGISRVEGFVGDSLANLAPIGSALGPRGEATGNAVFEEGEITVFRFNNVRTGAVFRVVISRTSHPDAYGIYRMFPRTPAGNRVVGVRAPWKGPSAPPP